jgi:hypothetical protein
MAKVEVDIFMGWRWATANQLKDALKAHGNHRGTITKFIFKKISFANWLCVLEFEHEEPSHD